MGDVDLAGLQRLEQGLAPLDLEEVALSVPVDNLDRVWPLWHASPADGLGQGPQPAPQPER